MMNLDSYCTVIGFDPGETTGYCVIRVRCKHLIPPYSRGLHTVIWYETGEINCRTVSSDSAESEVFQHTGWNFKGENLGVSDMLILASRYMHTAVVCEDFVLDPRQATKGRDLLTPVRIISSFGFGMWCDGKEGSLFVQNRTDPKRICTDARLKEWGLYERNSGPHARDALRHAFFFLRSCRGDGTSSAEKRWRAWPELFEDPLVNTTPIRKRQLGERIPGF